MGIARQAFASDIRSTVELAPLLAVLLPTSNVARILCPHNQATTRFQTTWKLCSLTRSATVKILVVTCSCVEISTGSVGRDQVTKRKEIIPRRNDLFYLSSSGTGRGTRGCSR